MSLNLCISLDRTQIAAVLWGAFIICVLASDCDAQAARRKLAKDGLPRVETIKDYPATGLMTGCGNLYFYPTTQAGAPSDAYVFISRGDGSHAWMNLNGRDVRLRQVRVSTRESRKQRSYEYRFGKVRISVLIQPFTAADGPVNDGDPMSKMRITFRNGRAVRVVRASGSSDC
ncbi:MAG: hypothetical protein QOD75_391 [Blastocatellia bacterium]|jgi:hypothetical protein|nr:hypothetical protein [Blastocatellia bacterium]